MADLTPAHGTWTPTADDLGLTPTPELARRVEAIAPELIAREGVGAISAAWLLVAWSQPARLRSEAAFARLAGVAPIPARARARSSATGSTAVAIDA